MNSLLPFLDSSSLPVRFGIAAVFGQIDGDMIDLLIQSFQKKGRMLVLLVRFLVILADFLT
jgi:hypothetical protein